MIVAAFVIEGVGVDLTGKQEDRDRIGPAFGNPGEGVGRARSGSRAHDARFARHTGIAIGGEAPACSLRIKVVPIVPFRLIAS